MNTRLLEPFKLGPLTLPNRFVMAPLTRNRATRRPGAEPAGSRILRPARHRGTVDHRGEPGLATGPGISGHPGHLLQGTGRGLAQGHRARARTRRAYLPSALACRPHFTHLAAAQQRRAGRAFRDPRQGQDLRQQRLHRIFRAARAGAGRNSRASSRVSSVVLRTRSRPVSTASRCMAPTATCSTSSPGTAATSAPTPMADRSRTAPG